METPSLHDQAIAQAAAFVAEAASVSFFRDIPLSRIAKVYVTALRERHVVSVGSDSQKVLFLWNFTEDDIPLIAEAARKIRVPDCLDKPLPSARVDLHDGTWFTGMTISEPVPDNAGYGVTVLQVTDPGTSHHAAGSFQAVATKRLTYL